MEITVRCPKCSRELQAPEEAMGEKGTCPSCGKKFALQPASELPPPEPKVTKPVAKKKSATMPEESVPPAPSRLRHKLYGVLLLALAPLIWDVTRTGHADYAAQLQRSLTKHPEIFQRLMEIYERKHVLRGRDFFSAFPGNRIDGALLPFNTWWHWGMAAAALVVFLAIVRLMFGPRATKTQHLFWTAVFTAVVGSLGFVGLHYATNWTEGFEMRGGGEIAILFYLCKFTSYSYYAAMRQYPFVMSFLSFAIGAGLLIELLKATPLLLLFTSCKGKPGWRGLALWGMAAGIGFGAAEGINYAREFYNGSAPASDYLTRFVTGTALHAIWTASVGVGLFNLMEFDRNKSKKTPVLFLIACALPVILHALFATYLNRGMETGALVTGAISFLWLALQIEWASVVEHARRQLSEEEPGVADERKGSVADPVSALTPGD